MKSLLIALAFLFPSLCSAAVTVRAGTNIANYPNNGNPSTNNRYIMELPGVTNQNISHLQLKLNMTQGLATVSYVTSTSNNLYTIINVTSNSIGTNSFAKLEVQTNGTRLGLITNQNWTYGVTGSVSGATAILGVNDAAANTIVSNGAVTQIITLSNNILSAMPANLWTNSGGFVILTTNGPVSIASTGLLGGLVVTQDIRFLGHNSASNSVWVCTNATTGEGEWRTAASVAGGGGLAFDPNTNLFNLQYEPVRGSTWYAGTNGTPTTNQARAGFEFSPFWRALRMGQVAAGADFFTAVGNGSNYWNNTNIGPLTVGFGSNAFVKGAFSSVLGGGYNAILTNATYSTIAGGAENLIDTNIHTAFIGSGSQNRIRTEGFSGAVVGDSVIVGGTNNAITSRSRGTFIGAGEGNDATGLNVVLVGGKDNTISNTNGAGGNVIVGGESHILGGNPADGAPSVSYAFIGGGFNHQLDEECDFSVISGGRDNSIGFQSTNATIAGGAFNQIGSQNVSKFCSILGGERNTVDGLHNFSVGTSNKIDSNVSFSGAIGVGVTNVQSSSLLLGYGSLVGKVRVRAATNATVGGIIVSTTTTVASAGAAETNLISVTIPAHSLTNSQDRLTFRTSGRFAATSNAKQLKVVYGSETILDGTSQVQNAGAWTIEGEIIRTGDTSQSVSAELHCAMTNGMTTTSSLNLAQTNGINTTLKVTSTAAGDGDVTNRTMTVWWWPAP